MKLFVLILLALSTLVCLEAEEVAKGEVPEDKFRHEYADVIMQRSKKTRKLTFTNRQRQCAELVYFSSRMTTVCGDFRFRMMVVSQITLLPVVLTFKITLPCTTVERTMKLDSRFLRCEKRRLKRCRCLRDARKAFCIRKEVKKCARRNTVREVRDLPWVFGEVVTFTISLQQALIYWNLVTIVPSRIDTIL